MIDEKAIVKVNGRWGPCHVFKNDRFIGKSILDYGEYNPDETEFIISLAQGAGKNKTVLDIGANIGAISQALEYSGITVEAFEPQPAVFSLLKMNFKGPSYNIALGDFTGIVAMPNPDYSNTYNYGGVSCGIASKSRGSIAVPIHRLDEYNYNNVSVIKIDVEGYEEKVLHGALETIKRCRPILYLEDDRVDKRDGLYKLLQELGYKWESHHPFLYRENNFFGKKERTWDIDYFSENIVCYPR
jgi:FkbM family methyltransferase